MRIALFIYSLRGGGAQQRALTLANGFAERGHVVDLVVIADDNAGIALYPGVRVVVLKQGWRHLFERLNRHINLRGLFTACAMPALACYLRDEHPDVLLSGASHVNLVAIFALRFSKMHIPLVLRASNYPSGNIHWWPPFEQAIHRLLRWTLGVVYPWADHIIAVSQGVAREVQRLTGLPDNRVTTIYNPVVGPYIARRAAEPVNHVWVADRSVPLIIAVGRLTMQKDYPTLIRAFARVRAVRAAHLVILGEGRQRHKLEKFVHELRLDTDVALLGHVDNPLAWMSKAAVLVLSSAWEGLPGVLIEALACGCPVVSTDCPSGPHEILEGGIIGPLVPVHDDRALAAAILKLLAAPPARAKLLRRAEDFRIDAGVDAYLRVLAAQVAARGVSAGPSSTA
ncbi:glycosyltransferase [Nitrosomonas communis]|uniref:Glycosyltransferase involved in cell wall bisynthesis n=1 Tax=Nitrosomonas communis TaxID=44574 RepID=A0A1I4T078_9PROT|nr:Glycosyltransferase involved in cell wall bisynthesis [Nitrosomonas communis]